jgi:hypothetical protein
MCREQTVPVEFTNVPSGLTITGQSTSMVQVWLRGTDLLFDSIDLETFVARCDLSAAGEGVNIGQLQSGAFSVPFGLELKGSRHDSVHLTSTSSIAQNNDSRRGCEHFAAGGSVRSRARHAVEARLVFCDG